MIGRVMRGWRTLLYTPLWAAAQALHLCGRAVMYLAAGTLRRHDMREATAATWDDFSRSEDLILSGLMFWERDVYDRFLKPADHVLLVGCGSGRDLIALLKRGHRVAGLDVSGRALALARRMLDRERLSAELYTGAVEVTVPPGSFDAIIFSWFCYGYIPQRHTRVGMLESLRPHLTSGGRVVISYEPLQGRSRTLPVRLTRFVTWLTRSDWRPERGDVIDTAGERRTVRYEHQFRDGVLDEEAHAAGFAVVFHQRGDVGVAVLMTEAPDAISAGAGRTAPSPAADR